MRFIANVLILLKGAYRNEKVERNSFFLSDCRLIPPGGGICSSDKGKEAHEDEFYSQEEAR